MARNFVQCVQKLLQSCRLVAGVGASLAMAFAMLLTLSGCSTYRWGSPERVIPGSYKQVFIPMFKNYSKEPGIEVDFTSSIRQEFERSKVARLSDEKTAEVQLLGEIKDVQYVPGSRITGAPFPTGTILATSYDIKIVVVLTLIHKSDGAILWTSSFTNDKIYYAPQVSAAGVNSVDPLYNLSARRQNIQIMSQSMMAEAHDRMTENF